MWQLPKLSHSTESIHKYPSKLWGIKPISDFACPMRGGSANERKYNIILNPNFYFTFHFPPLLIVVHPMRMFKRHRMQARNITEIHQKQVVAKNRAIPFFRMIVRFQNHFLFHYTQCHLSTIEADFIRTVQSKSPIQIWKHSNNLWRSIILEL